MDNFNKNDEELDVNSTNEESEKENSGYDPGKYDPKGYNPKGYNGPRADGFDFYDRGPKEGENRDYDKNNYNRNNGGNGEKRNSRIMIILIAAVVTLFLVYFMSTAFENATSKEMSILK